MFRLPPQPLLAPTGYRIPIRGRALDGPLGPLASRLGYPGGATGRGRGRGKGKGRQRNRNRAKGANKKAGTQNQPVIKVEEENTVEVTENTAEEVKDDIIDENWQVISEETEDVDSPNSKPKIENYVDFHSDMFDASTAEGFSTFSDPVLVISDEPEVPAAAPIEEVITEDAAAEESTVEESVAKDVVVIADEDTKPTDKSQEVTIVYDDAPASNEEQTEEQPIPAKESAKASEKPSPTITAITAPKPPSPKEIKKTPYGSLHCEVCNVYCYQQKHMKQHLGGRRHRMNVEAQGYSAQKCESKKKERSDSIGKQDGGSGGKGKHMSEAEKKYKAFMKSAVTCPGLSDAMQEFFRHKEPLIGLKYSVEVGKSVDDPNPVYYCSICNDYFNSSVKLRHFTGTLHRKTVVKAEFPHKCLDLPKDADDVDAYRKIAQEIEKEVGRQVHLIRRKVVTTESLSKPGELSTKRKGSDRTLKALLDLPPKEYLLEDPGHGYKGPLLEPHDRVVRVVPPSLKREREMGTWSPPPPAKRRSLLDPHEHFAADDLYMNFERPPDLLSGPLLHLDVGPPRPPLLPPREEPMDFRMFRQGLAPPKPLLSLDLPPIMSGSSMSATLSSFSEQLRRMLDTMDSVPVGELIRSEEDASIALHISNGLTKALLFFRMHSTPNIDRELGSVYSMFSGGRH